MDELFSRSLPLLGEDGLARLKQARVAVIGLGGVGSFVAEGLIRGGVGSLLLVDSDTVSASNRNRQLHATTKTVGQLKTVLMAERARDINPDIQVSTSEAFVLPENVAEVLAGNFDYVVDAVDTVAAKLAIAEEARRRSIPALSVMGTGNKLDPSAFQVADIYETSGCPLCRAVRRELRKRGVDALEVVYSREEPVTNARPPGSVSFVPPVAGFLAAGVVIKRIAFGFKSP